MGEFRDLIDAFAELKNEAKQGFTTLSGERSRRRSIASRALDGTCYFPAIVDDSIPLEDAITIGRALERRYSTFVLTTLTMNPYMTIDNGELSAADFVKKFHQNMRVKGSNDTGAMAAIGAVATSMAKLESTQFDHICDKYGIDYSLVEEAAANTVWHIYEGVNSTVANKDGSKWNFVVEEMTNPTVLNDIGKVKPFFEAKTVFSGGPGGESYIDSKYTDGDEKSQRVSRRGTSGPGGVYFEPNVTVNTPVTIKPDSGVIKVAGPTNNNKNIVNIPANLGRSHGGSGPMLNHLMDTDFKKANDLVPTMLHIRVYPTSVDGDEELPDPIDFVLGVKVTLHSVVADAMVENLARGINKDNHFFEFVKWTTGETRFFKDFVFAMDQQKWDAKNLSSKNKGWFVASKKRKEKAKILAKVGKNAPTPIMTVVVSKDCIELLAKSYGYDIEKSPMLLDNLMENYYLLGFVIVNPATNRVDINLDGFTQAETLTLNTLQKEETREDKKFKEMMRAMGRSV